MLVTRAQHQSDDFSDRLSKLGAAVIQAPFIQIDPPLSWDHFDAAVDRMDSFDWVIFASANAVSAFFARLSKKNIDRESLGKLKFAAIGSATAAALDAQGVTADFSPTRFIAEQFIAEFPIKSSLAGLQFLWPKGDIGRMLIAEHLREAGAYVQTVECYRTGSPLELRKTAYAVAELLQAEKIDAITLLSGQTARNMAEALASVSSKEKMQELVGRAKIFVIGPETAKAAGEQFGASQIHTAQEHTTQSVIEAICAVVGCDD